jgi:hypothetical protein
MSTLTGSARTDSSRCVIDAMGGTTHNYSYCIRPPPTDYMDAGSAMSMANVGRVFNELSKYVDDNSSGNINISYGLLIVPQWFGGRLQ